jgi:hypothetical protein
VHFYILHVINVYEYFGFSVISVSLSVFLKAVNFSYYLVKYELQIMLLLAYVLIQFASIAFYSLLEMQLRYNLGSSALL